MDKYDIYSNPLNERYASKEMSAIFSERRRATEFRRLWTALAEAEKELGLNISDEQIKELKDNISEIDFAAVSTYEKKLRHDVMAHIHAYGDVAPAAKPIIHLGATSCFVTDNADLIIYHDAFLLIKKALVNVIDALVKFAKSNAGIPTLGYTHLQSAQTTTVGKRATLWIQDLMADLENIDTLLNNYKLRGVKGTTGTQASFLKLFEDDHEKVKKLDKLVTEKMGFKDSFAVTGQTYPRKFDYQILSMLSGIAQSAGKFSSDMRLAQAFGEMEEPFEETQVGSSAMAYKRNPMRSERIAALSRYLISLPVNTAMTASTQWFERTLDDSANRRIVMGQAFMAADAILNIYLNIAANIVVNKAIIGKRIYDEIPYMMTEDIIMEGVKKGGDRQVLHEKIRSYMLEIHSDIMTLDPNKAGKAANFKGKFKLLEKIEKDECFKDINIKELYHKFIVEYISAGRAFEQTNEYFTEVVNPMLKKNKDLLGLKSKLEK